MRTLLIVATLLVGCASAPPVLPLRDLQTVDAHRVLTVAVSLAVWERTFGSAPSCALGYEGLHWRQLEDEAFNEACHVGVNDARDACTEIFGGMALITIRARPWSEEQLTRLRVHELTHWLHWCSGRSQDGDPQHNDSEVWPQSIDRTMEALGYGT